jgi:NADH:ubiquinone oxidoreductase subunit 6 (subunit J)
MRSRASWLAWLLELAVVAALAAALVRALGAEDLVRSAELTSLAGAVTVIACFMLALLALDSDGLPTSTTMRWAALAAVATAVLAAATGSLTTQWAAVAAGTFIIVGCFGSLLELAATLTRDRLLASALTLAVAALAATATLWLGPIAERFAATDGLASAVVAASPLTYLAVLADFDYLRATWFYEHTALGSLRYEYPHEMTLTVVYASPLAAAAALRWLHRSKSRPAKEQEQ